MTKQNLTYEQAFEELQRIARAIEEETISVDDLAGKIKRAAELSAFCQARLRSAEESINTILQQMNNEE